MTVLDAPVSPLLDEPIASRTRKPATQRECDRRNPQVAARMVLPLTRMAAYDAERQLRMTAALQTIAAASPSNDLGEVVDKALTANG